jgi:site-specific recombinase XerD
MPSANGSLDLLPFTHRHLRAELVFCHADGSPFTQSAIEAALRFACKRAGLRRIGSHTLRHTFASHLAMRGAAPKAIQDLARSRDGRHDGEVHAPHSECTA